VARTVLVVDDHAGFRARVREMLEISGYDVVGEAADGASAVTAARRLRPDVVLLDVRLPDMSGFDVAEQIAGESGAVVITSSHDASVFRSRMRSSAARGFIAKQDLSGSALADLIGGPA
jgi:DNA-binding NarL/FixJ family response regulator